MKRLLTNIFALALFITTAHSTNDNPDQVDPWIQEAKTKFSMTDEEVASYLKDVKSPEAWTEFKKNNIYLTPKYQNLDAVKQAIAQQGEVILQAQQQYQQELDRLAGEIGELFPTADSHPSRMSVDELKLQIMGAILKEKQLNSAAINLDVTMTYTTPIGLTAGEFQLRRMIHEMIYKARVLAMEMQPGAGGKQQRSPTHKIIHLREVGEQLSFMADKIFAGIIPQVLDQLLSGPYVTPAVDCLAAYRARKAAVKAAMDFFLDMEKELVLWMHCGFYGQKTGEISLRLEDAQTLLEYWGAKVIIQPGGMNIIPGVSGDFLQTILNLFWAHQTIGVYELYLRGANVEFVREVLDLPVEQPRACWLNMASIVTCYNNGHDIFDTTNLDEGVLDQRGVRRYPHPDLMINCIRIALDHNIPPRVAASLARMRDFCQIEQPAEINPQLDVASVISLRAMSAKLTDPLRVAMSALNPEIHPLELRETLVEANELLFELMGYRDIFGDAILTAFDHHNRRWLDKVAPDEKDSYQQAAKLTQQHSVALMAFIVHVGQEILKIDVFQEDE